MTRRLLITGATGFIGGYVMQASADGAFADHEVIPWDRQTMGDLLSPSVRREVLDSVRPDAVLHLAWSSTQADDYQDSAENSQWALASSSFLQECLQRDVWFVAIGSAADSPGDPAFDSPYSAAKRHLRLSAEAAMGLGNVSWLRPQFVVSVEDQRPRVVREYLRREVGTSVVLTNPDQELDFIHVADVVSGIVASFERGLNGTVDLGSGYVHSVSELVDAVKRLTLPNAPPHPCGPRRPAATRPDALLQLGWWPIHTDALFGDSSP